MRMSELALLNSVISNVDMVSSSSCSHCCWAMSPAARHTNAAYAAVTMSAHRDCATLVCMRVVMLLYNLVEWLFAVVALREI